MDREEAIEMLNVVSAQLDITDQYGEGVDLEPYDEALDMAIEALQREEAEANGYCHRIKPKDGDEE